MAVTNEKSTQVSNADSLPIVDNVAFELQAKLKFMYFKHTQGANPGDIGSTSLLARIPAGQGYILKQLSLMNFTAFGAARTMSVGYAAHTKRDGAAVVAAPSVLEDARDVSAANAKGVILGTGTNAVLAPSFKYDSKAPIDIIATIAGGTWPAGAVIEGWIAYTSND